VTADISDRNKMKEQKNKMAGSAPSAVDRCSFMCPDKTEQL